MDAQMRAAEAYRCPRWEQLPGLELYMDQVMLVLGEPLTFFGEAGAPVLTSAMINNYVKQKIVPAPIKKKYDRRHIAALMVVSVLKRVLSIGEIAALIDLLSAEAGLQPAYDLFCTQLERTVRAAYIEGALGMAVTGNRAQDALSAAMVALGGKLLAQRLSTPPPKPPPAG